MQHLSEKLNCNALRAFQAFIVNAHFKNTDNNHTENVNGVAFVTRKHKSPKGPIFSREYFTYPRLSLEYANLSLTQM